MNLPILKQLVKEYGENLIDEVASIVDENGQVCEAAQKMLETGENYLLKMGGMLNT